MGDEVWRIDYQMAPNADPEYVSREDVVRERLARQFGKDVEVEIVWVGPYAYRSEYVDRMRHGRLFFMGDSAKVVSPFGARGGNTGVADADNLAWKLAAVLRGQAPESLLDSYHDERHQAAVENVRVTNRTARFLRPPDGIERVFRNATISLARQHPFARSLVNTGRMAVANTYTQSAVCDTSGGRSVQNVALRFADGSAGCVNDLLRWSGSRMLLLVFGNLRAADAARLRALSTSAPLLAVQVTTRDGQATAREHVRDPEGHLKGACHIQGAEGAGGMLWALVRPDAYVAATGTVVDARLIRHFSRAMATPLETA